MYHDDHTSSVSWPEIYFRGEAGGAIIIFYVYTMPKFATLLESLLPAPPTYVKNIMYYDVILSSFILKI